MDANIIIRKFGAQDREAVRRISCETAFLGEAAGKIFSDAEILADALTIYFTDFEPESCFVAVANNKVVGYILGAKNVKLMDKIFSQRIIRKLVFKAFLRGVFFNLKNLRFFWLILMSLAKNEFYSPDFSKEFPAILHINLDNDFQGQDVGSELMENFLEYLRQGRVSAVHLATISEGAKIFFGKMGFDLLFQAKRSYLKAYLGKDLNLYVFGRRL